MGLINQDNRVKRDISGARTANDVIRRFPDLDKVVIKAGQIELEGYTSINGNFQVDTEGNMVCNDAKLKNIAILDEDGKERVHVTRSGLTVSTDLYYPTPFKSAINNDNWTLYPTDRLTASPCVTVGALQNGSNLNYGYFNLTKEISNSGGTSNQVYNLQFDASTSSMRLKNDSDKTTAWLTGHNSNGAGYLSLADSSGTVKVYSNGSTGNITCVSLTQTSKEEYKKNFEKLENALDIVKDTDIYKYNLKDEKETDKKHIGIVIGDNFNYRKEITSKENDGVYLYSMVSVLWKAVQEQQKEIEELKKVIK